MRVTTKARVALAVLAAAGATAAASNSYALDCNDPSLKNPIYVYGSSAVKPTGVFPSTGSAKSNPCSVGMKLLLVRTSG